MRRTERFSPTPLTCLPRTVPGNGEDNNAEIYLITGQSFSLKETVEELGAKLGVEVTPLQVLTLLDGGRES